MGGGARSCWREKEHTRLGDELARQRRELPWVRVENDYRLDTDDGPRTLPELFDGRSQLLIYHFMFGPSYEAGCPINSSIADSINGVVPHLNARDVTMLLVSQAPLQKLQSYKLRMGWDIPGVVSRQRVQLRPRLLDHRRPGAHVGRPEPRVPAADRREQCQRERHRCRGISDREPRLQRLHPRRRGRLPDIPDLVAWARVPDGLPPILDRTLGPRRGRRIPALDPPPRRVRPPVNAELGATKVQPAAATRICLRFGVMHSATTQSDDRDLAIGLRAILDVLRRLDGDASPRRC